MSRMRRMRMAAARLICAAALSGPVQAAGVCDPQYGATEAALTRAEVVADLNLWRRFGLHQHEHAYPHGRLSDAYQQAWNAYRAQRCGPAYIDEVLRATVELAD